MALYATFLTNYYGFKLKKIADSQEKNSKGKYIKDSETEGVFIYPQE